MAGIHKPQPKGDTVVSHFGRAEVPETWFSIFKRMTDYEPLTSTDGFEPAFEYAGHAFDARQAKDLMRSKGCEHSEVVGVKKPTFLRQSCLAQTLLDPDTRELSYTFCSLDNKTLHGWTSPGGLTARHNIKRSLEGSFQALCYIPDFELYLVSSMDMHIYLFDLKLNLLGRVKVMFDGERFERALMQLIYDPRRKTPLPPNCVPKKTKCAVGVLYSGGVDGCAAWKLICKPVKERMDKKDHGYELLLLHRFPECGPWVTDMCMDPDGDRLMVIREGLVEIFNAEKFELQDQLGDDTESGALHVAPLSACLWYPHSQYYVTSCLGGLIKVWTGHHNSKNMLHGRFALLHTFTNHQAGVTGLGLHPVRGLFVSASHDASMRVWSLESLAQVFCIDLDRGVTNMYIPRTLGGVTICVCEDEMKKITVWRIHLHAKHVHSCRTDIQSVHVHQVPTLTAEDEVLRSPRRRLVRRRGPLEPPQSCIFAAANHDVHLLTGQTPIEVISALPADYPATDPFVQCLYSPNYEEMLLLLSTGEIQLFQCSSNTKGYCKLLRSFMDPARVTEDRYHCMALLDMMPANSLSNPDGSTLLVESSDMAVPHRNAAKTVAVGTMAGLVSFMDLSTDSPTSKLVTVSIEAHTKLHQMRYHQHSRALITVGEELMGAVTLKIWSMPLCRQDVVIAMDGVPSAMAVASRSPRMLLGMTDGLIKMVYLNKLTAPTEMDANMGRETHTAEILSLDLCDPLRLYVSSSKDLTIQVRDYGSRLLHVLELPKASSAVSFLGLGGSLIFTQANNVFQTLSTMVMPDWMRLWTLKYSFCAAKIANFVRRIWAKRKHLRELLRQSGYDEFSGSDSQDFKKSAKWSSLKSSLRSTALLRSTNSLKSALKRKSPTKTRTTIASIASRASAQDVGDSTLVAGRTGSINTVPSWPQPPKADSALDAASFDSRSSVSLDTRSIVYSIPSNILESIAKTSISDIVAPPPVRRPKLPATDPGSWQRKLILRAARQMVQQMLQAAVHATTPTPDSWDVQSLQTAYPSDYDNRSLGTGFSSWGNGSFETGLQATTASSFSIRRNLNGRLAPSPKAPKPLSPKRKGQSGPPPAVHPENMTPSRPLALRASKFPQRPMHQARIFLNRHEQRWEIRQTSPSVFFNS